MGTRNLTCVVKDGEFKVAQYGQWDGYPSGSGIHILNFLKNWNREQFESNLETLVDASDPEFQKEEQEFLESIGAGNGWMNMKQSALYQQRYYSLCRDRGSEILDIIQENENVPAALATDFASDSLFCEWAYVIDLDNDTLEVYEGFKKQGDDIQGKFKDLETEHRDHLDEQYAPVSLIKTYSLNDLPDDDTFLNDLEPPEEFEDEEISMVM